MASSARRGARSAVDRAALRQKTVSAVFFSRTLAYSACASLTARALARRERRGVRGVAQQRRTTRQFGGGQTHLLNSSRAGLRLERPNATSDRPRLLRPAPERALAAACGGGRQRQRRRADGRSERCVPARARRARARRFTRHRSGVVQRGVPSNGVFDDLQARRVACVQYVVAKGRNQREYYSFERTLE